MKDDNYGERLSIRAASYSQKTPESLLYKSRGTPKENIWLERFAVGLLSFGAVKMLGIIISVIPGLFCMLVSQAGLSQTLMPNLQQIAQIVPPPPLISYLHMNLKKRF